MAQTAIQLTEESIKILAGASKELALFLMALMKSNKKISGNSKLGRLIHEGNELKIFRIKEDDIGEFKAFAKRYGVVYSLIKDKGNQTGQIDLITSVDRIPQINYFMEKMGYIAPNREGAQGRDTIPIISPYTQKKTDPQREQCSSERGNGLNQTADMTSEKPSVKGRLAGLRAASMNSPKAPQLNKDFQKSR